MDENRIARVEKDVAELANTLSTYSENTKRTVEEKFSNLDLRITEQNVVTQSALAAISNSLAVLTRSAEPLNTDGQQGEEKPIKQRIRIVDEHDSNDESEKEEEEELYRTPPMERKRWGGHSDSELIRAMKHHRLIVRDPPSEGADSVETWLVNSLKGLSKAFPNLPPSQAIEVVSSRLPTHIHDVIRSCDVKDKEKFVSHVTSLYSHRERGEEASKRGFYGYSPEGKTLLEISRDLLSLAENIHFPKEKEKRKAINQQFVSLIPHPHRLELERQLTILGESCPLLDLLAKVYENKVMLEAINLSLKPSTSQKNVVKQVNTSFRGRGRGAQNDSRTERCRRCGSYNHNDDTCTLYTLTTKDPCPTCKNSTGFTMKHSAEECVIALAALAAKN